MRKFYLRLIRGRQAACVVVSGVLDELERGQSYTLKAVLIR